MAQSEHDYWYLECRSEDHFKFYEISVLPNSGTTTFSVTTRHGRINTKGRTSQPHKQIHSIASARTTAHSLAESKIAKGYKTIRNTPDAKTGKAEAVLSAHKAQAGRFGRLMLEE